jgi:hypothetical protein
MTKTTKTVQHHDSMASPPLPHHYHDCHDRHLRTATTTMTASNDINLNRRIGYNNAPECKPHRADCLSICTAALPALYVHTCCDNTSDTPTFTKFSTLPARSHRRKGNVSRVKDPHGGYHAPFQPFVHATTIICDTAPATYHTRRRPVFYYAFPSAEPKWRWHSCRPGCHGHCDSGASAIFACHGTVCACHTET